MKASELLKHIDDFLKFNEDCEIKLFSEDTVFQDVFDEKQCEEITDIRAVNDWPLPGESIILGNAEQPGRYLVFFYSSSNANCLS
jgi:hypothetical protein